MTAPRVSIGLPVFNGGRQVGEAARTLLEQDWRDFELYISDNASVDDTRDALEPLLRDPRVRYLRHDENRGAAWNFNHVARATTGELFLWAAHDDRWHPTFLRRCVDALDAEPEAVTCNTAWQPIDVDGLPVGPAVPPVEIVGDLRHRWQAVLRDWSAHAAIYGLIRRSALDRTRPMRPIIATDVLFVAELLLGGSIIAVPDVLHEKRVPREGEPYRTPAEMLTYLGARRTGSWFPRLRITRQLVAAVGSARAPLSTKLLLGRDAAATYMTQRYWSIDGRELAHRLLRR